MVLLKPLPKFFYIFKKHRLHKYSSKIFSEHTKNEYTIV
jgi:hypothetical protein